MTTSVRTLALFTTYRAMHLAADEMAAGSRVCALFRTGVYEKPSPSIYLHSIVQQQQLRCDGAGVIRGSVSDLTADRPIKA